MRKINVFTDRGGKITTERDVKPNKKVKLEQKVTRTEIRAKKVKAQKEIWEKARKEKEKKAKP